ncbi:FtsX-like permease family protein [Candidatus Foliamicus sp.]
MLRPLPLAIAWRYLRAPTRNRFISFIGLASVVGMVLGVAALIVVISVMDGFRSELRDRLLRFDAQVKLVAELGEDWREVAAEVAALPSVDSVTPVVELEGLLSSQRRFAAVRLVGMAAGSEGQTARLSGNLIAGSLDELHTEDGGLALGRHLAWTLGVDVGDRVRVLVPRPGGRSPRLSDEVVRAIFLAGVAGPDSSLALASLRKVSELAGMQGRISALEVRGKDPYATPAEVESWAASSALANRLGLAARSWMSEHEALFRTVQLERAAMAALLAAIIAVAVFNILATLVMSVNERRGEIAILATLGARPPAIMSIFCLQGLLAGLVGVSLGGALGVWLARNVDPAMRFLEGLLGFEFLPAEAYYLTEVPSELSASLVFSVIILGLLLSALASWYPARRAAQVDPASVLRYE